MLSMCDQEEPQKGHSRFGITAHPGNGSPAKSMPEPLPDIYVEHSSALTAASIGPIGNTKVWNVIPAAHLHNKIVHQLVCISTDLKDTHSHAGQPATLSPCIVPSGGTPLVDSAIIQRMQAALIPKQMPQKINISGEGLLDKTMCDTDRCVLCT